MNKKLKYIIIFLVISIIFLLQSTEIKAETTLDEIQKYDITVDVRNDGSLDMNYKISWKVLDSDTEGPLEWVKIGIPNEHIDTIIAKSNNIKNIDYYSESGQTYIRVDFDRAYYAGETVDFEYSFHQGYMYTINEDTQEVIYKFTPGWFEDIEVKNLTIKWNAKNCKEASTDKKDGSYFKWNTSLAQDEKYNVTLKYDLNAYSFSPDKQFEAKSGDNGGLVIFVIVFILVIIIVISAISHNSNGYNGGFGSSRGIRSSSTYIASTHHTSCVHSSCACACACACAGGGRAGCSLKDFYGTNIQTKVLKKIIKI